MILLPFYALLGVRLQQTHASTLPNRNVPDSHDSRVGRHSLNRQFPPELATLSSVLTNASALTIEFVILGASELLGALRAVVAAAGAERGTLQGHARRRAGEDALGEHVEGVVEGGGGEMGGQWLAGGQTSCEYDSLRSCGCELHQAMAGLAEQAWHIYAVCRVGGCSAGNVTS